MPPPQDSQLLPKLSRNTNLSMRSSDVCRNDINTIQALMLKHDIGHSEVHQSPNSNTFFLKLRQSLEKLHNQSPEPVAVAVP